MMTEETSSQEEKSFTECSKLQPADLRQLQGKNKEAVDRFLIRCINNPKIFFNYISTRDFAAIQLFLQMLGLLDVWPVLERMGNEAFLQACDDERLLQYAVTTYNVTIIPLERLKRWLLEKFPDNSDETIQKIADIPFALNLTIIALIRQNPSDEKIKNLLGKRSNSPQAQQDFLNLAGVNLSRANLRGANLSGANLEEANLCGANLREANLKEAGLYRAHLEGANLRGANLEKAILIGATLCGVNLYGANLEEAILCGAHLEGAHLEEANLKGAILSRAILIVATLCGAILSRAILVDANLCGANLEGANLEKANLTDANLCGANLKRANLTGVCLQDTIFDKTTRFSLDDQDKLPHFISTDISTPDGLVAALNTLLGKTEGYPQRDEIKKCVVEEIKRLIERNCDNGEKKELWRKAACARGFILSLNNPVENTTTNTTTSTVSNLFVSPRSSSSPSSSSSFSSPPPAASTNTR